MKYVFKAPGKVFLFGEYFVLNFGSALLFSSHPYFEFHISKGQGRFKGIHPQSPAGLWVLGHKKQFLDFNFHFLDPYKQNQGFGASSSQFLFVYFWTEWMKKKGNQNFFQPKKLWHSYQETIGSEIDQENHRGRKKNPLGKGKKKQKKLKASGADLLSQWSGGILELSFSPFFLKKHFWPFKNKSLIVVSKGNKLKTYKHLESLKRVDFSTLKAPTQMALRGFKEKSWEMFVGGVNLFYKKLLSLDLVSQNTKNYVKEISTWEGVEALKGSGAMGQDHLVIFCDQYKEKFLKKELKQIGLKSILTLKDVSKKGFSFQKTNA